MPSVYPTSQSFNKSTQFDYTTGPTLDFQTRSGTWEPKWDTYNRGNLPATSSHYGPGTYNRAYMEAQAWAKSRELAAMKAQKQAPDYLDLSPSEWSEVPGAPNKAQRAAWQRFMRGAGAMWRVGNKLIPFAGWALSLKEFYDAVADYLGEEDASIYFDEMLDRGWTRNDWAPYPSQSPCGRGHDFTNKVAYCTVGGAVHELAFNMPAQMGLGVHLNLAGDTWSIAWSKTRGFSEFDNKWFYWYYHDDFYTKPNPQLHQTHPDAWPSWRRLTDAQPQPNADPRTRPGRSARPTWRAAPHRDRWQEWRRKNFNDQTVRGSVAPGETSFTSTNAPTNTPPPTRPTRPTEPVRPPGVRTRERKLKLFSGPIKKFIDEMTEYCDMINAAYYALPCQVRTPARKCHSRAQVVWQNIDHMDVQNFILNLIYNEIEDRLIAAPAKFEQEKILSQTGEAYGKRGGGFRQLQSQFQGLEKELAKAGIKFDDPFGRWYQSATESIDAAIRNALRIKDLNKCFKN
jgi:hypothetical protein